MRTSVVVEDQPVLASAYGNKFRGEGFKVEVALDGEQGPDSGALSLCKQLRQSGFDRPIIIYSTAALFSEQQEGLRAGATAYLVKPEELFNVGQIVFRLVKKPTGQAIHSGCLNHPTETRKN